LVTVVSVEQNRIAKAKTMYAYSETEQKKMMELIFKELEIKL